MKLYKIKPDLMVKVRTDKKGEKPVIIDLVDCDPEEVRSLLLKKFPIQKDKHACKVSIRIYVANAYKCRMQQWLGKGIYLTLDAYPYEVITYLQLHCN